MSRARRPIAAVLAVVFLAAVPGCSSNGDPGSAGDVSGRITVGGSRTVAMLTSAVAEDFEDANPDVDVWIRTEGTGVGFEQLCARRIDVGDAAWTIDPKAIELCRKAGVEYRTVKVGSEALVLVVNRDNPVECLTSSQLAAIWRTGSEISSWDEVPGLKPRLEADLELFGADEEGEGGAREYFGEAVSGVAGGIRDDYREVGGGGDSLAQAVAGAPTGMAFVRLPTYLRYEDTWRALAVDDGAGCVEPSEEAIQGGSYLPLSRPTFLYLRESALRRPVVAAFVGYYLEHAVEAAVSTGFVPLTERQREVQLAAAR